MDPKNDYWDNLMGDDANAATYMETYGEGPGSDTRHTIGSLINDGESILDVGCGPGWNYDHFKKFGPEVVYKGTDLSPRFVRVAKARQPEANFERCDCRDLRERDASWDIVLLQDILEHTNGYEITTNEALRVAKKRVIVTFWHMFDPGIETHINDDTDKGTNGYGAWYNREEWEKFLDSLPYPWMELESKPTANRQHLFYVIDKEGHV